MATLVAPLEQHYAKAAALAPHERRQDRRFGVALVSCLTVAALAIHGYHPYAEDGGLYLAGVERLLDPTLFPSGTAFVLEPTRHSFFAATVAAIVKVSRAGLPQVLLALHLASIWTTLFAAWMLASRCWTGRHARTGAVVLLACWLSLPVAGTALMLMDPYLTARSFSTPCMVLTLVGVLDATETRRSVSLRATRLRGILLCVALLVIGAVMHPLMAAYSCAAALVLAGLRSRRQYIRVWGTVTLAALALVTAACLDVFARPETAAYRRIALTRTYWFPAQWSWYELLGLAAPLIILAVIAVRSRSQDRSSEVPGALPALCGMAIVAGGTAWLAAVCFARSSSPSYLLASLQPLRIFQIVYLIMTSAIGAALGTFFFRRARLGVAAVVLLGGVMFAVDRQAYPDSPHLELPHSTARNLWVEAFVWIRDHTPTDAIFALDSDYINARGEDAQCFRALAERSALPDYSKDGGEASIAPDLTAAWTAGQLAQRGLNAAASTDDTRAAALQSSGATWIVLDVSTPTQLQCPFTNAAVKVCRLR